MPTLTLSDHLTEQEAAERASLISDLSYDIDLDISDDRLDEAGSPVAATFGSLTAITMTLRRPAPELFLNLNAPEITRLTLDGTELASNAYTFESSRIVLRDLGAGEHRLTVEARCAYQHNGVGLHRFVDPVDRKTYVYTHFEPFDAHRVFACFDQPDLKARFTTTVRAPGTWEVCGNGRVAARDEAPDGTRTWRFNTTPLLPTYLMAVAGAEYHVVTGEHDGIPMRLYCRTSLAGHLDEQAEEIFEITRQGLDFFKSDFGFDYPFDEYNQLFVPEFNMGAMENPGCVTFNELYVFRSRPTELQRARRAETILHEMAHVYGFGDVATMKWWGDLWLNETFATYMAHRAMVTGGTKYTNAWVDFANTVKSVAARQDQLRSTHPISTPCRDTDEVRQNFDGITYHKGGSVLKQLVAWVGEDAFVTGVQDYFVQYRWANASLDDFLGCIEKASGRDLAAWSKEWLQTTGMNTLRPDLQAGDGRITSLRVLQEAAREHPTLRAHRIAVGLYSLDGGSLRRTKRIELDIEGPATVVEAAQGEPAPDLVVVNDDDLTFAKVRFDQRSQQTLIEHLGALDDPLTRAIAWASMWDMTRDGELRTRDYVECVIRNAASEQDITVLERVLSQAVAAVDQFGAPDNRAAARSRLAETAHAGMTADAGSERQITWARCFIATADSPAQLDRLEALLDGRESIDGLTVDTDLRWMIVGRLATEGRADEALIDEEVQRDPTDFGRRRAAACLAARPTEAAKAAAWAEVTTGKDVNLSLQQALMVGFNVGAFAVGGFMPPGERQLAVTRPYAQRWADSLTDIWRDREFEEAEYFTELLFPRTLVERATVDLAQRAIGGLEASGLGEPTKRAAMRILTEGQDGIERALRARAADAG
jgi:aminopeptidase N